MMDCIVLLSQEKKGGGGCRKEGWRRRRRERMSKRVRGSGVVRYSSEGHGSLALAKNTVLNTCSCLRRPFNLLITCQSITRQPDQMSGAARTCTGKDNRKGEEEGGLGKKRREGLGQIACLGELKMKIKLLEQLHVLILSFLG
ncbi:hypothetical protein GOODEAATRI_006415 [Goodea atripinnis]|uniref:Uncharacterized protein n=1 Tax=Goodea atripinnis TaxID=208336 RepID=A0ABV0PLC4_9TELE